MKSTNVCAVSSTGVDFPLLNSPESLGNKGKGGWHGPCDKRVMIKMTQKQQQQTRVAAYKAASVIAVAGATGGRDKEWTRDKVYRFWVDHFPAEEVGIYLTFAEADALIDDAYHQFNAYE